MITGKLHAHYCLIVISITLNNHKYNADSYFPSLNILTSFAGKAHHTGP